MLFTLNPDGEINGYLDEVERGPYPRVHYVKLKTPITPIESEEAKKVSQELRDLSET